jgi:hypothetical protein
MAKAADIPDFPKKPEVKFEFDDTARTTVPNKVKVDGDAYTEAMNGGRHATWAKQYANKPTEDIQKGIRSLEKQIELHKDKIKNPEKYYPNFRKLDIREQEANINKIWPRDIAKQQEQKSILEGILKNRGKD